jgi:hypothetical protein
MNQRVEPILRLDWHVTPDNSLELVLQKRLSGADRERLAKLLDWILDFATDDEVSATVGGLEVTGEKV